jgi:hypothetical protein
MEYKAPPHAVPKPIPIFLPPPWWYHRTHYISRRREGKEGRSRKEEPGPRGHRPSSSEMKVALLVFTFTKALLCTARQRLITAPNHHRTAILLPQAQGEPLRSPPSSAHHRMHTSMAATSPYRRWPRLSLEHHHACLGRLSRSGIAHLGPKNAKSGVTRDMPAMARARRGEVKTSRCEHGRGRSKGSNRFALAKGTPCTP